MANMETFRVKIGCFVVSLGVALMPKEWRTKKAINNLIAVNGIKNVKNDKRLSIDDINYKLRSNSNE